MALRTSPFPVQFLVSFFLFFLFSFPSTGFTFEPADLAGTWYGTQLVTGDAPGDDPRWGYGSLVVDNSSNFTATWNSPTQTGEVSSGTLQLNGNGILSIDNDPLIPGAMNDGHDLLLFVDGSAGNGGNGLLILCKRQSGVSFSATDLTGTWDGHQLVSGDAPGDDLRWGYGNVVIGGSGNYTSTWNSPTSTNEVTTGTIQVNAGGMISVNNDPLINGYMNDTKDLIVFVDGSTASQGNAMVVMNKRGIATFATADLDGTWYGYGVVSGDAPAEDPRWGYGRLVMDGSGNYTSTWNSPTRTDEVSSGSIGINGSGIISINNDPLIHGVMSADKDRIVFVDGSASSQGNALYVAIRRQTVVPLSLPATLHLNLLAD